MLGGQREGAAEAGQFDLSVTIDTQKLFGWAGGTLQTSMTYRQGELLPVNLLQQPQEIYGRGDIARLVELSYEQKLLDNHLTVKFGRLPEGEFNDFSCDFANLTFCGPPAGNIVGNYWFNAPIAQWAAWGRIDVGNVDFRTGVYEFNPQDLDLNFSPGWFCCATGVTGQAEVGWSPKFGPNALQGRYQAGFWDDTAGGPDVLLDVTGRPFVLTGLPPLHRAEQYGVYVQGIQQITGTGAYDPEGDYRPRKQNGWTTTKGLEWFPAGLNCAVFPTRWKCDFLGCAELEAARDGALVGGFAQAGGFGGSRGRHELPCGGAAVRGELFQRDLSGGGVARARQLRAVADGRRHAFAARRGPHGFPASPSSARA